MQSDGKAGKMRWQTLQQFFDDSKFTWDFADIGNGVRVWSIDGDLVQIRGKDNEPHEITWPPSQKGVLLEEDLPALAYFVSQIVEGRRQTRQT